MEVMKEEHSLGRLGRQAKFQKEGFLHQTISKNRLSCSLRESDKVKMAAVLPFHHVQQRESMRTNTVFFSLLWRMHLTVELE